MEKSTIKTSRKIYIAKYGIHALLGLNVFGMLLNYLEADTVKSGTLIAVSATIATIVGGLHFADGYKGHEKKHPEDPTG